MINGAMGGGGVPPDPYGISGYVSGALNGWMRLGAGTADGTNVYSSLPARVALYNGGLNAYVGVVDPPPVGGGPVGGATATTPPVGAVLVNVKTSLKPLLAPTGIPTPSAAVPATTACTRQAYLFPFSSGSAAGGYTSMVAAVTEVWSTGTFATRACTGV